MKIIHCQRSSAYITRVCIIMRAPRAKLVLMTLLASLTPLTQFAEEAESYAAFERSAVATTNEDTKVEIDMYVEYMAASSGTSLLEMNVNFKREYDKITRYEPRSEVELLDNAEAIDKAISATAAKFFTARIPVASSAGNSNGWIISPVYRMQNRSVNKYYQTPKFTLTNVGKYRLHYHVPEGFELYSRKAGTNETFRPGSILEVNNTQFNSNSSAFDTVILPKNTPGALPGKATSINNGNAELRFSLGFLANGKSAGYLDFLHDFKYNPFTFAEMEIPGTSYTTTLNVFMPRFGAALGEADLRAISFGDDVEIITKEIPGSAAYDWPEMQVPRTGIRQIVAPQCIVDITQDGFDLKISFYHPSQKQGRIASEPGVHGSPYDMAEKQPFVSYVISGTYAFDEEEYSITATYAITRKEDNNTYTSDFSTKTVLPIVPHLLVGGICNCNGVGFAHCDSCDGDRYVDCDVCVGSKTTECFLCDGLGEIYESCRLCGQTDEEEYPDQCSSCGGRGEISKTCPTCDGGQLPCYECGGRGNFICTNCGGTGEATCPDCEGEGYWLSQSTRGSYLRFNGTSHTSISAKAFDTIYESNSKTFFYRRPFPEEDIMDTHQFDNHLFTYYRKTGGLTYIYPSKDTEVDTNHFSTTSSRYYEGSFPAFNRPYVFVINSEEGTGSPKLQFTQETQVLSSITEGDQGLTTKFGYYRFSHTAPLHDTHHGRMKWRTNPDGSWIMYDYESNDMASLGQVTKVVTSWLDAPMPDEVPSSGSYCITTYTYAPDWEGVKRLPATITKTANYRTISETDNTYTSGTIAISGTTAPIWITTSASKPSSTDLALVTITKVFEGPNCPSWLYGLPYSTQAPDGSKESVAYQRNVASGVAFRSIVLKGIAANSGGQPASNTVNNYEGIPIDPLNMIPNISTAEVTIRNEYAQTIRTETKLYTGSAWTLIDSADMQYDTAGNLIRRQKLNGTLYEATYSGGRKTWEKDEQGVETEYPANGGYDARGRVIKTIRKGKSPYTQDLETTFEYDNENRVTKTTRLIIQL